MTEEIGVFWDQLTGWQKTKIILLIIVVLGALAGFIWDDLKASSQIRAAQKEAAQAERDKDAALQRAAAIAAELKVREEALAKIEVQKNDKQNEVNQADKVTADARADYDRAVQQHRTVTPGTDELCADLAALVHPCQ